MHLYLLKLTMSVPENKVRVMRDVGGSRELWGKWKIRNEREDTGNRGQTYNTMPVHDRKGIY